MESSKAAQPEKRVVPAATARQSLPGRSGVSLSPPIQKKPNETGLPDQLKEGAESVSGYSMDDVNVHYSSSKPAQLNAHAYAQGTDIHLGPGQEKHLPHEAWHVVQQKQGRVKPTMRLSGMSVNDDDALESEADVMGQKIIQKKEFESNSELNQRINHEVTIQRNGDPELMEPQQIQALPQPQMPNRDAERAMAQEAADSLILKSTNAVLLIENLAGLLSSIPVSSSRAARAIDDARGAAATFRAELDLIASTGIESAMVIANTSDAEMDTVFDAKLAAVIEADRTLSESLSLIAEYSNPAAHIAVEAGAAGVAAEIMAIADDAKAESATSAVAKLIDAIGNARGRRRDKASSVLDVGDTLNNIGGVAASTAGIVETFGGVAGAGGGAGVAIAGGALGILFGSFGVALGLYGLITGNIQKKQLRKIAPAIQDDDMLETLDYAKKQTDTSISRSKLVIGAGAAAITAGTLGLIALSVLSLGAVAAVAGVAAALLGLGIVAFKYFHSRSKRKAERRGFAEALVEEIKSNGPHKFEAISTIVELGLNPEDARKTDAEQKALIEKLTSRVGEKIKIKRQDMAEGILDGLVNGPPSKQFQAELIIKALGRDPGKARSRITKGETATEVSRIMAKLSSW